MKMWKCPSCDNLSEGLECKITGTAWIDNEDECHMNEWERGEAYCDECGFEESMWRGDRFELVEVE